MSNFERIYLGPDHNQIEGRMWCQDDDPASLGEPWTEYVRADLYAEWVTKANKATALASQYLRERDALLTEHKLWAGAFAEALLGVLQENYTTIQAIAHTMAINYRDGRLELESAAIAKAEGRES
jgi:hypothetical protein